MSGNGIFHFPRFSIRQDSCAMKVTSDACLFGAWIELGNDTTILDIGTGTGLLALMACQRFAVKVDALEIDQEAAQQAIANVQSSPWRDRITVHPVSLRRYLTEHALPNSYDHIVCNPPFYNQASKSQSPKKRLAWHAGELTLEALLAAAANLLKPLGSLQLLLPYHAKEQLLMLMQNQGWFAVHLCEVRSFADRSPHRLMAMLKPEPGDLLQTELVVYEQHQVYTPQCSVLLQPFLNRSGWQRASAAKSC